MKHYDKLKTLQLALYLALTFAAVIYIFTHQEIFHLIADNKVLSIFFLLFWAVLAVSFVFMYMDFSSYSSLKRRYSELDLAVFSDPITGIANRNSCDAFIEKYLDKPLPKEIGCITFDVTNLMDINNEFGRVAGNNAIRDFSVALQSSSKGTCFVGRNGGNKFLAIFSDCSQEKMKDYLYRVGEKVDMINSKRKEGEIKYAYGQAFEEPEIDSINELIACSNRRAIESYRTFVDR